MRPRLTLSLFLNNFVIGLYGLMAVAVFRAHFENIDKNEIFSLLQTLPNAALLTILAFTCGFLLGEVLDSFLRASQNKNLIGSFFRAFSFYVMGLREENHRPHLAHLIDCLKDENSEINVKITTSVSKIFNFSETFLRNITEADAKRLFELILIYIRQNGKPAGYSAEQWHATFGWFQLRLGFLSALCLCFAVISGILKIFFSIGAFGLMPIVIVSLVLFFISYYSGVNHQSITAHGAKLKLHTFYVLSVKNQAAKKQRANA
jgi:hypothetical protein